MKPAFRDDLLSFCLPAIEGAKAASNTDAAADVLQALAAVLGLFAAHTAGGNEANARLILREATRIMEDKAMAACDLIRREGFRQ